MMTLAPTDWVMNVLDLMPIPMEGRLQIMGFVLVEFILTFAGEKWLLPHLAHLIGQVGLCFVQCFQRQRQVTLHDSESAIPLLQGSQRIKRDALRRKWRRKGKLHKIIHDQLKYGQ
jgi:DNA mismatch repair protein MutH